jgi:putative transposase
VKGRRGLIEKGNKRVSLRRQCLLLGLNRSGLYYRARPPDPRDRELMNLLDAEHTRHPFYGVLKMRQFLLSRGWRVGQDKVRSLLRRLGLTAVVPRANLSKPHPAHPVYPYLLRNVRMERPGQVWSADITYVRLVAGFAYLAAVIDWYSRYVLAWRLSNTLEAAFCVEALQEALAKYPRPEIFNSDQGRQFTSEVFISVLVDAGVTISMDGRGRCLDNIFVERLWRSVKYEDVYLCGYSSLSEAREGLRSYFDFYNHERFHQALAYKTPWQVYSGGVSGYGSGRFKGLGGHPSPILCKDQTEKEPGALLVH